MRALILGGNGFIGSHIVDALLADRWTVRVLDRAMERFRPALPGVDYVLGDFGDTVALARALSGTDVVFHCVSTTLPKSSNEDPTFDVSSNVIQTIRLLEGCVREGIQKVVFLSSGGTVYGVPSMSPITEGHATDPECSYGITKLAIEKYLALFKQLHGLDYVILRPSNPFGIRQNPFGTQGAVAVFLGKASRGMPIEIWGDGEIVRDFVHVRDLAAGIVVAARLQTRSRVFNLGSGTGRSLNVVLGAIESVLGRRLTVNYTAGRIFDPPSIVLDISRARSELEWHPSVSMEEGIRETWDFVRNVRPG